MALVVLPLALAAPLAPYALTGPAVGGGLADYAERWEYNAFFYPALESFLERIDTATLLKPRVDALRQRLGEGRVPWDWLYRHVWPREVARILVGLAVVGWALWVGLRRRHEPPREQMLVLGGLLLLSPTLHPWYLLWVLPFAALYRSWGWLLFGVTIPLAYATTGPDVTWSIKSIEYLPPLALMLWGSWRAFDRRRHGAAAAVC